MRVNCDVCGGEPAAVLCVADEAALCSACDRRVHRANKLAGKHRRVALLHPSDDGGGASAAAATGPVCDVCKERRGLVFCVEDRAILCADCDDPIHSANDLTARHSRFLLVGAKLSTSRALADDVDPSSPALEQDSSTEERSSVLRCSGDSDNNSGGAGGAKISDYLTNICPGWRVDDLLFDESPFPAAAAAKPAGLEEHVPSMDADLFDVVAAGRSSKNRGEWAGELRFETVPSLPTAMAAAARPAKQKQRTETSYWTNHTIDNSDSDVFAVPEITPPPAKKARPAASSYWCF